MLGITGLNLIDSLSVISVINGTKPAFKTYTDDQGFEKLKNISCILNLRIKRSDYRISVDPQKDKWKKSKSGNFFVFIGKTDSIIRSIDNALSQRDMRKVGILLGYPVCCVKKFDKSKMAGIIDPFVGTYVNSTSLAWKLNNFSHFSGSCLIPHFPCSYSCRKSVLIAEKNYTILSKLNGKYARVLRKYLKLPILYKEFLTIVFNGVIRGNTVYYKNQYPSIRNNIGGGHILNLIKDGDKVCVGARNINVYHQEEKVGTIQRNNEWDGFLLKFH